MTLQNLKDYFNQPIGEIREDIRPIAPVQDRKPLQSEIERLEAIEVSLDNKAKALELEEKRIESFKKNLGKGSIEKAKILKQAKSEDIDYKELSFNCMELIGYLTSDTAFINAIKRI